MQVEYPTAAQFREYLLNAPVEGDELVLFLGRNDCITSNELREDVLFWYEKEMVILEGLYPNIFIVGIVYCHFVHLLLCRFL